MLKYWGPLRRQSYPPQPDFSTDQIPDLTGQVIIVTGAQTYLVSHEPDSGQLTPLCVGGNAGLGKETVKVD